MIADDEQTLAAWGGMELFLGLVPAELQKIATPARTRHLTRGTRIFQQGESPARAHAVIQGGVRISQSGSDGAQVVMRVIAPGEMFGTLALFIDRRYPADAVCLVDTIETSWSEAELLVLMRRHPAIAVNIVRIVAKHLQEVQNRLREISTQRVEQRVAHAVLRLARQAGRKGSDGTVVPFPLRRKDIADISGTTLHTASRILAAWERSGVLTNRNRCLTIRRPSALSRIAEEGLA
ncbi:MAG: Crp/Fnr family transcriptional regulator [Rhodanobacteraceae bacterium]